MHFKFLKINIAARQFRTENHDLSYYSILNSRVVSLLVILHLHICMGNLQKYKVILKLDRSMC